MGVSVTQDRFAPPAHQHQHQRRGMAPPRVRTPPPPPRYTSVRQCLGDSVYPILPQADESQQEHQQEHQQHQNQAQRPTQRQHGERAEMTKRSTVKGPPHAESFAWAATLAGAAAVCIFPCTTLLALGAWMAITRPGVTREHLATNAAAASTASGSQRTQRTKCTYTPGCEFYGHPGTNGRCSGCWRTSTDSTLAKDTFLLLLPVFIFGWFIGTGMFCVTLVVGGTASALHFYDDQHKKRPSPGMVAGFTMAVCFLFGIRAAIITALTAKALSHVYGWPEHAPCTLTPHHTRTSTSTSTSTASTTRKSQADTRPSCRFVHCLQGPILQATWNMCRPAWESICAMANNQASGTGASTGRTSTQRTGAAAHAHAPTPTSTVSAPAVPHMPQQQQQQQQTTPATKGTTQTTQTWQDGSHYAGSMKDGKRDGHGAYHWADGSHYTGEWQADMLHGQGTFAFVNGDVYQGAFKQDRKSGHGKYVWRNGQIPCFEGTWVNDEPQQRQASN